MVRKEDLCEWFKNLRPCKRLDYMCGLLHMCLPTELRFIGTVLEDLAKKDYHSLRDAEIKANQLADLSNSGSTILDDCKLRTKIIMALALLNSTNSSCAKIIFDTLDKQLDEHISGCIVNEDISEEILLILTMAIHHPAFKINEKLKLGDTLNKVEKLIKERNINRNRDEDEPDLKLPSQSEPEASHKVSRSQSTGSEGSKKASIISIEIINYKDIPYNKKNEKSIKGYQIHSTWSNGEVREVFMKPKELHELHLKFVNQTEEKKSRKFLPYFPARGKDESAEKLKEITNEYLSTMAKVLTQFPDCDVFTEPFRGGNLIHRTPAITDKAKRSVQTPDCVRNNPLRLTNCISPVQNSPGPLQVSSSGDSPSNSRTSSPTSPVPATQNRTLVNLKASTMGSQVMGPAQMFGPSHIELSLYQLLVLLNLEKYFDSLKEFSVKQVMFMSTEDFVKSGLPFEAHERLRKKLDKLKHTLYSNGMNESISRAASLESAPTYIPVFPIMSPPYAPFPHPPSEYPHLGTVSLHHSPAAQLHTGSNSPVTTEMSSPPSSPLQLSEQMPPHQVVPSTLISTMSPPVAVASASTDIKATKQSRPQTLDASGSEDDRVSNLTGSSKGKGRGRPQHSQSLPQISQSAHPVEETKITALPNSLSVPHTHPALINAEPRTDSHQYVIPYPVVNGYTSDPPPQPLQGPPPHVIPRGVLGARPAFKTAQPTHTGQKNLIPMPATYDMQHPSSQGSGRSNGIHIQHFMPASTNPSNQIIIQQNASTTTHPLGSQPQPPSLPEGCNNYSMSPLFYIPMPQPRLANSSSINSAQSLLSGAPLSHGQVSLASTLSPEQVQASSVLTNSELLETNRTEGSLLNPPSHTPPHHNLAKSQNTNGPDSGTPSPPLGPAATKQPINPEPAGSGRGVVIYNGLIPPLAQYIFQPQQSLPNGLPHEVLWPGIRFANHLMPNQLPYLYGNTIYSSHSPTIAPAVNSSNSSTQVIVSNPGSSDAGNPGKSICYNCGQAGHDPLKCEENTMENMSKSYRLNYKPKSDSE
ncbi:hypothetical protein Btru_011733 [Bulinus truncatus]|nr:hypothetical protein Btru_011733 [Bulinus truncatus]